MEPSSSGEKSANVIELSPTIEQRVAKLERDFSTLSKAVEGHAQAIQTSSNTIARAAESIGGVANAFGSNGTKAKAIALQLGMAVVSIVELLRATGVIK